MNIKDRLKTSKRTTSPEKKENTGIKYKNAEKYFTDGKYVKNLLKAYIKNAKNIIFIINNSFDAELISLYFKSFIKDSDKNPQESKIEIVSEPSIIETVKIFENIISLDKSYIFGLKINKPDNILDKLTALIAVNFPNLQKMNIDTLISSSESVFVYFDKDKEGMYFISKIEEMVNTENGIEFEKIFDFDSSYLLSADDNTEINEKEQDDNKQAPVIIVNNTKPKKVNKYKLLREKFKRRKDNSNF